MKNILLNLIAFLLLMQLSCGKESKPYDPFPDNEVKATITVDGAAPILCESKGNATLFVKRTETSGPLITVVGCSQVSIYLQNVSSPGTYFLDSTLSTAPNTSAWCQYIVGNPFVSADYYFSHTYKTNTGNSSGSVTIESISSSYIKGTFNAICMGNAGKLVRITNGSFKGNF